MQIKVCLKVQQIHIVRKFHGNFYYPQIIKFINIYINYKKRISKIN